MPVDIRKLYKKLQPNIEERVVQDLAAAIHYSRDQHPVISWAAQEEAAAFFNEHGMGATMDKVVELGGPY